MHSRTARLVEKLGILVGAVILAASLPMMPTHAASGTVVALGASNTYGKGIHALRPTLPNSRRYCARRATQCA